MNDQANDLRRMARQTRVAEPPAARPRLVVFAGGKGGVGTTTLALGIAVAFAERGSRTMLVDADTEGPAVAALCGIEESATLADVLSLRRTAAEVLQTGPGGVRVLPGAWGAGRGEASWASLDRLITQLQSLGSTADLAVIDVGDGGGCVAEHLWLRRRHGLGGGHARDGRNLERLRRDQDACRLRRTGDGWHPREPGAAQDSGRGDPLAPRIGVYSFPGLCAAPGGIHPAGSESRSSLHGRRAGGAFRARSPAARSIRRLADGLIRERVLLNRRWDEKEGSSVSGCDTNPKRQRGPSLAQRGPSLALRVGVTAEICTQKRKSQRKAQPAEEKGR